MGITTMTYVVQITKAEYTYKTNQAEMAEMHVRDALNVRAWKNYGNIVQYSKSTSYATELDAFGKELNQIKSSIDAQAPAVTVLNPYLVHVANAMNMKQGAMIETLMAEKEQKLANAGMFLLTDEPQYQGKALRSMEGKNVPYIMPGTDYVEGAKSFGLDVKTNTEFTKLHEGFHYVDNQFNTERMNLGIGVTYNILPQEVLDNDKAVKSVILTQQGEGFADIGALGHMIRKGASPDIIEPVRQAREQSPDLGHQTAPILQAFSDRRARWI
jgi:hypothetical protein